MHAKNLKNLEGNYIYVNSKAAPWDMARNVHSFQQVAHC